jgi:ketosteroid isomerase-like protein
MLFGQSPSPSSSGAASSESPEIRDFQKIEDNWSQAINQRDQYALELVLSPLFVDVSASGDITTRNQQLAGLIAGEDKALHLEQRVITVRLLGDIAVANGTYVLHHKAGSAQVDEKGVFTHVFERLRGGWACINSQRTVLRGFERQTQEAVERRIAVSYSTLLQRQISSRISASASTPARYHRQAPGRFSLGSASASPDSAPN